MTWGWKAHESKHHWGFVTNIGYNLSVYQPLCDSPRKILVKSAQAQDSQIFIIFHWAYLNMGMPQQWSTMAIWKHTDQPEDVLINNGVPYFQTNRSHSFSGWWEHVQVFSPDVDGKIPMGFRLRCSLWTNPLPKWLLFPSEGVAFYDLDLDEGDIGGVL